RAIRPVRCRVESDAGSKLPVRWFSRRIFSCLMNLSPAWIRSPSPKFKRSYADWSPVELAFSSPTTTCERRWEYATVLTLSMKGLSLKRARLRPSPQVPRRENSIWEKVLVFSYGSLDSTGSKTRAAIGHAASVAEGDQTAATLAPRATRDGLSGTAGKSCS